MSNYKTKSICPYNELLVEYLYNEIDQEDKSRFASHLSKCSFCSDELIEFSSVHKTIQSWRMEEFDRSPNPSVVVPVKPNTYRKNVRNAGRHDLLRRLFNWSPGFAAAGLALVVVFGGLILFNFSRNDEIAKDNSAITNVNEDRNEVLPNSASENNFKQAITEDVSSKDSGVAEMKVATEDAPPKISSNVKTKTISNPPAKKTTRLQTKAPPASLNAATIRTQTNTIRQNQQPKLSNFDDVEDNSLRLSDLMSELESK